MHTLGIKWVVCVYMCLCVCMHMHVHLPKWYTEVVLCTHPPPPRRPSGFIMGQMVRLSCLVKDVQAARLACSIVPVSNCKSI